MKRTFFVVGFILSSLFTQSAYAQLPGYFTTRLQFVLDSVCNKCHIKGASAAVLIPNGGVWTGAYGVSHAGTPITTDMLFGMGSNTKTYTAALILKLQEEGLLELDDTIGKWIHNRPNINGQITVRQLLNHTSGLFNYLRHPNWATSTYANLNRVWQPEEILPFVLAPDFAPGTGWNYSNTNYLVAGLIIKAVLSQPAYVTLRSRILAPQGLNNVFYYPNETPTGIIPHVWSAIATNTYMQDMDVANGYVHTSTFSMANMAGGLLATAEDNVTFWSKLLRGQIINTTSLQQMKTFVPVPSVPNISYGLGIEREANVNGHVVYHHGGTILGFVSENLADATTGACITVFTNQDSVGQDILFNNVVKALHLVTYTLEETLGVSTTNAADINIYPNPATTSVTIHNNTGHDITGALYDITGRTVLTTSLQKGSNTINIRELPSGHYIMRLVSTQGAPISSREIQIIK